MDQQESSEINFPLDQRNRVRAVLKALPAGSHDATLICPLCGASVPARGLRANVPLNTGETHWQLAFTCPACGLITAFNTDRLTSEKIEALQGSAWASRLRQFARAPRTPLPGYTRQAGTRHFLGTWITGLIVWMLLIGNFNPPEVLWGIIVSAAVARFTYKFAAIDLPNWTLHPARWQALAELTVEFIRQLVVQNVTLSLRVLRPSLPIKPGIVAVPTVLRDPVALTILGSLMTLTPDTVTMDIDQERGIIYVHWIDVQTLDIHEVQRLLSASLEEKISRWIT